MNSSDDTRTIIIFDGVCNFCNGAVNFIIKKDVKEIFYFTPNQSSYGKELFKEYSISNSELDSVILVKNGHCYTKSDAALEIIKQFNGFYSYLYVFKILPKRLRDYFYDIFAKNRYRVFGKMDSCMIPSKKLRKRFIL